MRRAHVHRSWGWDAPRMHWQPLTLMHVCMGGAGFVVWWWCHEGVRSLAL